MFISCRVDIAVHAVYHRWVDSNVYPAFLRSMRKRKQMNESPILSPHEMALARSNLYSLLSQLYLHGLTPDLLPFTREIPELAAQIPAAYVPAEAAAAHQTLFGLNVFPYESIFLDASGMLGGLMTDAVQQTYAGFGYTPDTAAASPDHLGVELGALAFLCGAEADAQQDGLAQTAQQMQEKQRRFLAQHLLRWLLPCAVTICRQKQPFFQMLTTLAVDLVASHYAELTTAKPAATTQPSSHTPSPPSNLPAPPAILDDEKTGLKDIATYLTTPRDSGLFLSRDDVGTLGRQQRLPRGFGGRVQMLVNVMRSAAQYDGLPTLLAALQAINHEASRTYATYYDTLPALIPFIEPWQARAATTADVLTQITSHAKEQGVNNSWIRSLDSSR